MALVNFSQRISVRVSKDLVSAEVLDRPIEFPVVAAENRVFVCLYQTLLVLAVLNGAAVSVAVFFHQRKVCLQTKSLTVLVIVVHQEVFGAAVDVDVVVVFHASLHAARVWSVHIFIETQAGKLLLLLQIEQYFLVAAKVLLVLVEVIHSEWKRLIFDAEIVHVFRQKQTLVVHAVLDHVAVAFAFKEALLAFTLQVIVLTVVLLVHEFIAVVSDSAHRKNLFISNARQIVALLSPAVGHASLALLTLGNLLAPSSQTLIGAKHVQAVDQLQVLRTGGIECFEAILLASLNAAQLLVLTHLYVSNHLVVLYLLGTVLNAFDVPQVPGAILFLVFIEVSFGSLGTHSLILVVSRGQLVDALENGTVGYCTVSLDRVVEASLWRDAVGLVVQIAVDFGLEQRKLSWSKLVLTYREFVPQNALLYIAHLERAVLFLADTRIQIETSLVAIIEAILLLAFVDLEVLVAVVVRTV